MRFQCLTCAKKGSKSFGFYRAAFTLEAYESEVDQILKDANAKVRRLAEARAATVFGSTSCCNHAAIMLQSLGFLVGPCQGRGARGPEGPAMKAVRQLRAAAS